MAPFFLGHGVHPLPGVASAITDYLVVDVLRCPDQRCLFCTPIPETRITKPSPAYTAVFPTYIVMTSLKSGISEGSSCFVWPAPLVGPTACARNYALLCSLLWHSAVMVIIYCYAICGRKAHVHKIHNNKAIISFCKAM